ncbi:hypothetical protein CLF_108809 [Clonorchis sinensis]|uniref:Uncharacterized protein n=1 Tax=Clonorchis sinensis TaxID=79923 RepID=G7YRY7_CLOSI|nr:hypothetical protein CLF_108809 [Clonorchis sinensis]
MTPIIFAHIALKAVEFTMMAFCRSTTNTFIAPYIAINWFGKRIKNRTVYTTDDANTSPFFVQQNRDEATHHSSFRNMLSVIVVFNNNSELGHIDEVTFVIFRILLTPGMYIWAILNRRLLPVFVSTVLITSFTIFTVMNFILFWRVLSSERRIMREGHTLKSKDKFFGHCDNPVQKAVKTSRWKAIAIPSNTNLMCDLRYDDRLKSEGAFALHIKLTDVTGERLDQISMQMTGFWNVSDSLKSHESVPGSNIVCEFHRFI